MDKIRGQQRLRKVLGKFNKQELPEVVKQLGVESTLGNLKRRNKRELVSMLVDSCVQADVSNSKILQLELNSSCGAVLSLEGQDAVTHCNTFNWRAYRINKLEGSQLSVAEIDSNIFSKRLQLYLGDVCTFDMVNDLKTGYNWLCLYIMDSKIPYSCFILRSPSIPFLFLAGVRKVLLVPLLEALCLTLECTGFVDLGLYGRCLSSLQDLAVNQHSQGPYSAYRLNQVDPNPLLAVAKRKLCSSNQVGADKGDESVKEKRRAAEDVFGTQPLPKLPKFVFKINLDLPNENNSICCKIKFAGSNVLEGVKECVVSDCITLPVPDSISCMPHCASNTVSIVETITQDKASDKNTEYTMEAES